MSLLASNNRIQKATQDNTTELLHIPFPQLLVGSTFYKRKWWNIRTFASSVWPQLLTLLSSSGSTISWCCSGSWLWAWTCWIASGASPKWWVSPAIPRAGVWRRIGWVPRVWKGGCRSRKKKSGQAFSLWLWFLNPFLFLNYQETIFIKYFFP